jgi:lipopolysaccharide/colanic/teichoic acid biosynthesis glycosyltransferase
MSIILLAAILTALTQLLLAEAFGWFPWLVERLIRHAARQLPLDIRTRYQEDWLAELDALPGRGISTLIFAVRILVRARKVREEILGPSAPVGGASFFLKRAVDVAGSLSLLLLLAPVLSAAVIAIKLTSRGPAILRWRRTGRNGQTFYLLSLRTFYATTPAHNPKGSGSRHVRLPYTPVGSFLQRTDLEALPLLLNVLRGEMSFIGPSAKSPWSIEALTQIPGYDSRPPVMPGITGLAQLRRSLRGDLSPAEEVELDNYYATHRSLRLDLKILALTVVALFRSPR